MREMIHFNRPNGSELELNNISTAIKSGKICGDGQFTKKCNDWFEKNLERKALLTNSCTAALEMAAILLDAKQGDEVIMPSYTFVSTANAFVLRGIKPVFVDIRPDTLNIDEKLIESAITNKTKAIAPVHYAGVGCEMDTILNIAKRHNLKVIEDAAQGFGATYKGQALGTIGDMGTYSFHETKNIVSGEGGAIILSNADYHERAEIIREKGTNRSKFYRGQVDKYTWVDLGSSFLPSDMIAAYLYAQLEKSEKLNARRLDIWSKYHEFFKRYEANGILRRPIIPAECSHNAHMYYILFNDKELRPKFIDFLKENQILTVFHYVPLHSAPAGKKYCRTATTMEVTDKVSDSLLRMPMFYDLSDNDLEYIFEIAAKFLDKI
ncbi:MAG: dTDP-4-amino-4,6-dideoxygalactose transaminase [Candidatus Gastranaerophilales bacterium]|nr:dTDP-4-amino-4,6-dideoxygalactose transaminase [Candidatus Gastranaerophilales bacterium]